MNLGGLVQMSEFHQMRRLRKARLKIFQVHSLDQLQSLMKKELAGLCGVDCISIREKNSLSKKKGRFFFQCSLKNMPSHSVFFEKKITFSLEDKKFLKQVGQAIHVSLKHIKTYNQLQILKKQWESTFNAIKKPICLTDKDFNILSTNNSFCKQVEKLKSNLYRKNCFLAFFGSSLTEEENKVLLKFKILKSCLHNGKIFEIHSQSFLKEKGEGAIHLVIFTDMTKKIEMEKKIAHLQESAQMGIIASSIAHELANPLSGIQALLQLSQMKNEHQEKINEMLSAVRRCQQIIFQLLKSDSVLDLLKISKDKSLENSL